jgi:hypothetical protein
MDPTTYKASVAAAKSYIVLDPGSDLTTKIAAAAASGGDATAAYFDWRNQRDSSTQPLLDYISEKQGAAFTQSSDGDGNPIVIVNPPTGSATLRMIGVVLDEEQTDQAIGVTYQGVAEIHLDVDGAVQRTTLAYVQAGTGFFTAVSSLLAISVVLRALVGGIGKWMSIWSESIRGAQYETELSDLEVNATDSAVEGATVAEETAEGTELAVSVASKALAGVSIALAIVGVAALIAELLMKAFRHELEIHNLTDLDLELDAPWIETGKTAVKPAEDTKLWKILTSDTRAFATSCSYIFVNKNVYEGFGCMVRIKPNSGMPDGLTSVMRIPYSDDNTIWVGFDRQDDDKKKNYDKGRKASKAEKRYEAVSGDYKAILTINALSGPSNSYYSTLTIIDTSKYKDLLGI